VKLADLPRGRFTLAVVKLDERVVTDADLARFAGCQGLRDISVFSPKVTDAGVKELAAALPKCKIE
jgi:hypothetical protein